MDELRYIKPIQLFAEAEEKRLRDVMLNIREYDSPQIVRARYGMRKSELRTLPRIPQIASGSMEDEEYMEILKAGGLSGAEFAVNYGIESIMINFVKELIRQGLVFCEIKDCVYDTKRIRIDLSAIVGVPKIAQKRLDIDVTE